MGEMYFPHFDMEGNIKKLYVTYQGCTKEFSGDNQPTELTTRQSPGSREL